MAESSPGRVTGYAAWDRGRGYGPEGELRVWDLFADDRASWLGLLAALGSFASVTPTTLIRTSGVDAWRHLLRVHDAHLVHRDPYMLRVLHPAALAAMRYPDGIDVELPFRALGADRLLSVADGLAEVAAARHGEDVRELSPSGLALTVAGAQSTAVLRTLGHLTGDATHDPFWDALLGSRPVHIRDYF